MSCIRDDVKRKIARLHVAIVFVVLVALTPSTAFGQFYNGTTQLNPGLGLVIHNCTAANFAEAEADGFTWVRTDMTWSSIETTKGQYSWGLVDNVCSLCEEYHLKPDWTIDYGNSLYGTTCSSAGITGFASFAGAGAARCVADGVSGAIYEVWNEPDNFGWSSHFDDGTMMTPAQIAQLNNASVGPIHTSDSTAIVCTSSYGTLENEGYLGQMAFADGLDNPVSFNVVGMHTYDTGGLYGSTEGNGNDNPECLLAYNPSNPGTDLYPRTTVSMVPTYVPGMKSYYDTEVGRQLDKDCGNNQGYFAYEWVRSSLCEWMVGYLYQCGYAADDTTWSLYGTTAEQAMKFMTKTTSGKTISSMSYPTFSGTMPPNNAIWSVTLSGSPAVQAVWVPLGSASVPVPTGWTATDELGNNENSQIVSGAIPMQESTGVYYLTNSIVESTSLALSQYTVDVANCPAVTATVTIKNNSPSSVYIMPDIAARDPNGNNVDFGRNVGWTTIGAGQTLQVSATKTLSSSSPTGNYTVWLAYATSSGAWYNLAPTLTLTATNVPIVESSTIAINPATMNLATNPTVTATCTLQNVSASNVTLTPDVAARDPNGNACDFGSNVGNTTLTPGQKVAVTASRSFTTSSPVGNYSVWMAYDGSNGWANINPTLTLTATNTPIVETTTLALSSYSITLASNPTVTATCTIKNVGATSQYILPDVAARDPNGNEVDFGSNYGWTTLAAGQSLSINIGKGFTSSSPAGNYSVWMAYDTSGGTWYSIAPTLTA